MSTVHESSEKRERTIVYVVVGIVVLALMVIGLIAYRGNKSDRAAQDKADQLISALKAAGVEEAPSQDEVVGVLGDDGGATCADPGAALTKATLLSLLTNGTGGPGARPIIADGRVVRGQLLIIKIYCPDQLPKLQDLIDKLKFDDVVRQ
jgi:hypothetical protein